MRGPGREGRGGLGQAGHRESGVFSLRRAHPSRRKEMDSPSPGSGGRLEDQVNRPQWERGTRCVVRCPTARFCLLQAGGAS